MDYLVREQRTDTGRTVKRTRACEFCSAPPISEHGTHCIFGENGRYPLVGTRQRGSGSEVVVSDVADGEVAAIAHGMDITICSPRQAEALVKVIGQGPVLKRQYEEIIDKARRRDTWAAIR